MFNKLKNQYSKFMGLCLLTLTSTSAHASTSNPFPTITTTSGGNIVQTAGTTMESAMQYLSIGLGGLLILVSLGVIIHRMREDSRDRDHGNLIMTYVMTALGLTLGFVLIGIGWTAFNTTVGA